MIDLVGAPRRHEINEYAIKFLIGAIAFGLPLVEWLLAGSSDDFTSISASFWIELPAWSHGLWPRNIFVGSLIAIAALLLTYNGWTEGEMWLTKLASLAALLIAMFPCWCGCDGHEIVKGVHGVCAGVLFLVLATFCDIFRRRAMDKHRREHHPQPKWRAWIYSACGGVMLLSVALFACGAVYDFRLRILVAEWMGLWAFAVSWLTASHMVPVINRPAEREYLFRKTPAAGQH